MAEVTRTTVFETAFKARIDKTANVKFEAIPLEKREIKVQTTLVACPRFEPTPRFLGMDDYGGFAPPLPIRSMCWLWPARRPAALGCQFG